MAGSDLARLRTVRLTTRGRRSGQPRTVPVWFVARGERRIAVQHAGRKPAQWYWNLVREPAVTLDFGDGPLAGRATPIEDPEEVRRVLKRIRQKYWMAWLIQLIGRGSTARAAEIHW